MEQDLYECTKSRFKHVLNEKPLSCTKVNKSIVKILSAIQKTNILIYKSGHGSKLTVNRKCAAKRQTFFEPDHL